MESQRGSPLPNQYWIYVTEPEKEQYWKLHNELGFGNATVYWKYWMYENGKYKFNAVTNTVPQDGLPIYNFKDWKATLTANTPEQSSDNWQVGDMLPEKWLNSIDTFNKISGVKRNKANFIGNRTVESVDEIGWAQISGTTDGINLKPKPNYPTYSGNKVEEKYKIGDWVICIPNVRYGAPIGSYWQESKVFQIAEINGSAWDSQCIYPKVGGVGTYSRWTRLALPDEIPQLSTSIPVTESNAVIGMKVVRGRDWKWGNQDGNAGNTGEIVDIAGSGWHRVKWLNGSIQAYRTGENGNYDLYVAENQPSTLNQQPIPEVVDDSKWYVSVIGNTAWLKGNNEYPLSDSEDNIETDGKWWEVIDETGTRQPVMRSESSRKYQKSNNQSINQNKQTKTAEHGKSNNKHNSESSRWDILLSDSEEPIVSRSGSRTGTAGYCRGEFPTAQRGYQRIGKGIEGGKETAY